MLEEFDQFFEDFGVTCTLATGQTFTGILDRDYQQADLGNAGIESKIANLQCSASNVPNIAEGHILQIGDELFSVKDVEPDGTGMVLLTLIKQNTI